ncbi:hypothetical protein GCK32_018088 [Trichostrongylus colubriformis]|uniref:Uncharacterized protein n=1 Tax=Trichostrongylus colubriformis TaxID=6319 RepID=A0AAN8IEN7_TRICO
MGVETTFPVYEATSSGLLVLSGQLWMFVMYYAFETIKKLKIVYKFDDTKPSGNWQLSLDIWCLLGIVAVILSFIANPTYKRMQYEDSVREQQQIGSGVYEMSSAVHKPYRGEREKEMSNGIVERF